VSAPETPETVITAEVAVTVPALTAMEGVPAGTTETNVLKAGMPAATPGDAPLTFAKRVAPE